MVRNPRQASLTRDSLLRDVKLFGFMKNIFHFRKTISKEHISPELSMGHVELGLLFLQLAQVVILLIICCTKNGLQTMTKTVP